MSLVTLQLGQCGNQIGCEFFNTLANEMNKASLTFKDDILDTFFRFNRGETKPVARSCLIDMEPKVIQSCLKKANDSNSWRYQSQSSFYKQSGSANNWAYGYNIHGPRCREDISEIIRKETECCDHLGGFLLLHSLAGGTGSGLGAFLTQHIRDEYPQSFVANQIVWPHHSGEVIVQNYNTMLTLAKLYQYSDGILIFKNDQLHSICEKLLKLKRPSFEEMNQVVAENMASFLAPAEHVQFIKKDDQNFKNSKSKSKKKSLGENTEEMDIFLNGKIQLWSDPIRHLCAHPGYKLIQIYSVPQMPSRSIKFSNDLWNGLLKRLFQMGISGADTEIDINWRLSPLSGGFYPSVADMVIMRGKFLETANPSIFYEDKIHPPWYPSSPLMLCCDPNPLHGYEKSACLVTNSKSIINPLDRVIQKCHEMFGARAYLHQYHKYHVSEDDFNEAFYQMEQVIFNYNQI